MSDPYGAGGRGGPRVSGGWPRLRESRTVRAGHAPGTVVHCGLTDTVVADVPVSVVFCYDKAPDLERLAAGLGAALDRLPVFAGRLRTVGDALQIVCDDAGVPMDTYDVDETLPEAIARMTLSASGFVDHVEALRARTGEAPLLTVRLSLLAGGGLALGCSWHHAVGDLHSFMLLMRVWSAAVEGAPPPEVQVWTDPDVRLDALLPAEDCGRPGFRLPGAEEFAELGQVIEQAPRLNRTVQVYLGGAEAARLRDAFTDAAGQRLSMNDVLVAHVVSSIRQLDGDTEDRRLAMPVNVRRHLGIPPTVIGNMVSEILMTLPGGEPPERLAARIRAEVDDFPRAHLNLRANRAFLAEIGRGRLRETVPIGFEPDRRTFTFTNWSRFGAYQVVFDGVRPACFSPAANLQLPWVGWLTDGFDEVGFLVTVVVPAKLATRLRGPDGRAALHRFREPDDVLPELAGAVRKLA